MAMAKPATAQTTKNILLTVQIDALFVVPLPRPKRLLRHFGNFQQTRDLFTASIQTARSMTSAETHSIFVARDQSARLMVRHSRYV